ncbi:MAG: outer membrane beta-barrel protein [Paracoccaceae bacterium]
MQTKSLTVLTAVSALNLSGFAYAGAPTAPIEDTIAPTPIEVAPTETPVLGGEWTGFYGGLQLGRLDADTSTGLDGDDTTYGLHLGYDYDFGQFVLGGELDYDSTDVDLGGGAATIDSVTRLKARLGYDFGLALGYVTAGVADVDTSIGSETGEFYGIGVAYQVTDNFTLGGEILDHQFDDIEGSGVDADATTFTIRGSYRF